VGFTQDATGVTARFTDGREERGDVLVGADGIKSVIRAQLAGKSNPRFAGYAVWQAILPSDVSQRLADGAPVGIFRVLWGRGSRFSYYHVGGERLYWFCVLNAAEGGRDVDKGALLARFRGWMKPTEAIIDATDQATINRADHYDRQPMQQWGEGRVTLLGDAAHAMTFNVGQGACQAIEDGVVLAKCLGQHSDVSAALRAYEARRMGRTAAMQKRAWQLGSFGRWTNPLACSVRDQMMKVTLKSVALRAHREEMAYEF
jgi:2-polyprenyl-6-methoxyphenol hydroxylase-like FAD-dependent oxidoreductase